MPRKKNIKISEENKAVNDAKLQENINSTPLVTNKNKKTAKHYIIELLKSVPEQSIKMTLEQITELINEKITAEGRNYKYQRPNIWSAIQKLAENGVIKIKKGKNRRDPNTITLVQSEIDFSKFSGKRSPGRPEQKVFLAKKQYNLLKNQLKKTEKQLIKLQANLKTIKESIELLDSKNKKEIDTKASGKRRGRPRKV